eukprot:1240963-Rhodomonas_salina.1
MPTLQGRCDGARAGAVRSGGSRHTRGNAVLVEPVLGAVQVGLAEARAGSVLPVPVAVSVP